LYSADHFNAQRASPKVAGHNSSCGPNLPASLQSGGQNVIAKVFFYAHSSAPAKAVSGFSFLAGDKSLSVRLIFTESKPKNSYLFTPLQGALPTHKPDPAKDG
jgi:hypothetical protein